MPIHRVLKRLDRGSRIIEPGQLIQIDWLSPENIGQLEAVGAVARVHAPPLEALPGWVLRSERLAPIGIVTAEEFLEADEDLVCTHLEVQLRTVGKWRKDVTQWLTIPPSGKRRG